MGVFDRITSLFTGPPSKYAIPRSGALNVPTRNQRNTLNAISEAAAGSAERAPQSNKYNKLYQTLRNPKKLAKIIGTNMSGNSPQTGGSLGIVSAYNDAAKYKNTIKPKKVAIFKLIGSFGKKNVSWVPNFLKDIQEAVHDPYTKLSLANAKIYHVMYKLHSHIIILVDAEDSTSTVPPNTLSDADAVILQNLLRDHRSLYNEFMVPLIQDFKDATKETDDALHEFVKAVKEACEKEGGNSMTSEQKEKMDVLLQQITDVISITESPKSPKSSTSASISKGGSRKRRRGNARKTTKRTRSA